MDHDAGQEITSLMTAIPKQKDPNREGIAIGVFRPARVIWCRRAVGAAEVDGSPQLYVIRSQQSRTITLGRQRPSVWNSERFTKLRGGFGVSGC